MIDKPTNSTTNTDTEDNNTSHKPENSTSSPTAKREVNDDKEKAPKETATALHATEQQERVRRKLPLTRQLSEEAQKEDGEKKDSCKPSMSIYKQFFFKFYFYLFTCG